MAEEVAIKLKFDAGESVKEAEKLNNVLKSIKKDINIDNVDTQFKKLNTTIEQGGNSAEDLQRAVKSYQTIALTAGRTSPIGKEALQRASELQDKLGDLADEVKNLANDHKNLQGAMEIATGVTAGYQAFAGITALVGEENEELMKTMVKLQAVQGAMNGLMQLKVVLEEKSSAMILLNTIRTKALTGATILYNTVTKGSVLALKLLKGALIATGLGAIVVLIGTLVANWSEWKDTILDFISTALAPFKSLLQSIGLVESDNAKIQRESTEQRLEDIDKELKALEQKSKSIENKFDREIALLRASGKETFDVELLKLKYVKDRIKKEILLLIEKAKLNKDLSNEEKKEIAGRANELVELYRTSNNDIAILEAQHNKKIEDEKIKSNDKIKIERDKARDKEIADLKAREQLKIELQKTYEDLQIANIEDATVRKLATLELANERERQALIEKYGKDTELMKELELKQNNEMNALISEIELADKEKSDEKSKEEKEKENERLLNEQADFIQRFKGNEQEKIDLEKEFLLAQKEQGILSERDYQNQLYDLKQREIETDKQVKEAKEVSLKASTDMVKSTLGSLATMFEKNEKLSKAFAIAQAGIDTAQSISALVKNSQLNPANAVTGGGAGAIQFASGLVQIGVNMKKVYDLLQSTPTTSISASSVGGGNSGTTSTTQSNTLPTDLTNRGNSNYVDNGNNQPNKVYVVDSDIKAVMDRSQSIINVSSI